MINAYVFLAILFCIISAVCLVFPLHIRSLKISVTACIALPVTMMMFIFSVAQASALQNVRKDVKELQTHTSEITVVSPARSVSLAPYDGSFYTDSIKTVGRSMNIRWYDINFDSLFFQNGKGSFPLGKIIYSKSANIISVKYSPWKCYITVPAKMIDFIASNKAHGYSPSDIDPSYYQTLYDNIVKN